jgi:hypothetical protein
MAGGAVRARVPRAEHDGERLAVPAGAVVGPGGHRVEPERLLPGGEDPTETSFWVFVELGGEHPAYFIAPRWWVRNDIWRDHIAYLARYQQKYGHPRESEHHGIQTRRVEQWRDRWEVLGIFPSRITA